MILLTQIGTGNFAQVEASWKGVVVISSRFSRESSKDQHSGGTHFYGRWIAELRSTVRYDSTQGDQ